MVEDHVHHHLVFGAALRYQVDEGDAVESAEGVVGHRHKRTLGQVIEHLLIVDAQLDVEVLE